MMMKHGPYAPDRPPTVEFTVGGKNAYAMADGSYCPFKDISPTLTALASRCQGGFFSVDSSGDTAIWAGTATKLYKLTSGATFSDVSRVAAYGVPASEYWEFAQFGDRVFATNITDALQNYQLGVSAIFADTSGAPKARHLGVVANFLMLGNTNDGTYGAQTDGLWWSAINAPTSFPTVGTSAAAAVQSGRTNISGGGGAIQRIIPRVGNLDALIIQERALTRCTYVGSPDVFAFQPLDGARGSPAPASAAIVGGMVFYLGDEGFFMTDGSQTVPIGAGWVDDYFHDDVNPDYIGRSIGAIDAVYKTYFLAYASAASTDGTLNKIISYNYVSKMWAPPAEISVEFMTYFGGIGYTLEDLDTFGTVDSITASFDSKSWQGIGQPVLTAFNTSHAAGPFDGAQLEVILESGDLDLEGARYMVNGMRPMATGLNSTITCGYGTRNSMNNAVTYSPYVALNRENKSPVRTNSRYFRHLTKVAGGGDCSHIQGVYLDITPMSNL